jgi:hypothetical protein
MSSWRMAQVLGNRKRIGYFVAPGEFGVNLVK